MENDKAFGVGEFVFLGICAVIGIAILLLFFATSVPAGAVGIQDTFGSVDNNVLQPGFHLKGPFTRIIPMSTQTQKYFDYGTTNDKATIVALSNDGMSTTMGIAVNYHLSPGKVVDLYKNVGTDYSNVVMVNPIHSVPRDLISKYDTKTLYSASQQGADRARIEQELYSGITERLNAIGVKDSIVIEQVSIREIDFPQSYKDAITAKMNMDTQIAQKNLEVQVAEAEAKKAVATATGEANANIERARGEAEGNLIRTRSLSPMLLQYTFIESIKTNPKVMYIPVGPDGLPMFKSIGDTA
ncbi:MAG: prohibitin family protein [Methanoregula sp.]|jgi:regulator of protease activity HflC (stomatin/prohibitin superfamily)|nr:prohibitin family protein [Methanoregula sp.]